ncbi:MAG: TRAP transporter permease [Desulfobacteraceae bacterium]|nr:MAG: TRAP transporter permease [Desulfobacteraceae bacterium]
MSAGPGSRKKSFSEHLIAGGFILFAGYHLWTTVFGMPSAYLHRPVHLMFAVTLGFMMYSFRGRKRTTGPPWPDLLLGLLALASFGTVAFTADKIAERLSMVDPLTQWELFVGAAGILLVLELVRRVVGWALTAVIIAFLVYAFLGPHMPRILAHKGFAWKQIVDYQTFGLEGIYSLAVGVSSTYIVVFIIFGTFLEMCGAGGVMMDLGRALAGRFRGGPAKIAVITSAFFGTISGSAAANVYATGSFTIPLMKRIGYPSAFAGAVESAASTGGQLMPPIMGAAAFLIADILGLPYIRICAAALIPSILYFFSILMMVDFEAAKLELRGLPREDLPDVRKTMRRSFLLLPILVLVVVMIMDYTPFMAAFIATLSAMVVSWFSPEHRMGPKRLLEALEVSGRRTVLIASACAGAGLIVGVVTLTGIGLNVSSLVISASGGSTIVALLLIMAASILMGMGTPTTVAYIIVATLGVPALENLGFATLPSHFFVFYFGVISMITPPVAVAAYAGAEIAGADMMRVGFTATRLCLVAFIIPFICMYEPALLMVGSASYILVAFVTAMIGIVGLAGALEGWYFFKIGWTLRLPLFASAILMIVPGLYTDVVGLTVLLAITAWCWARKGSRALAPSN